MISKNAKDIFDLNMQGFEFYDTGNRQDDQLYSYEYGFKSGYQVAQDESKAEIEKLRAALIRITKNVSKSGQDEVFYAIANEALQKDDEGEK